MRFEVLRLVEQPPFVRRYVRLTMVILFLFVAVLFLPWQQTVHGVGRVVAFKPQERSYAITATIDGVVGEFYVVENEEVKKGQKLFLMSDLDPKLKKRLENQLQAQKNRVAQERLQLRKLQQMLSDLKEMAKKRLGIYDKERLQLQNEQKALLAQQEALGIELSNERRQLQRLRKLYKEGIVATRRYEEQKNRVAILEAKIESILQKLKSQEQKISINEEQKRRFESEYAMKQKELQNKIAAAKSRIAKLIQEKERLSVQLERYKSRVVYAKSDGYVVRILQSDKNRYLKKGTPVMEFLPKEEQRALLVKVSDFNMPLVQPGLKARIIFYGWPSIYISGWPKISHGTYGGVVASTQPMANDKGEFFVYVLPDAEDAPWPPKNKLRIGTQASVWIRLSTVPLWYEIWRLMLSQPPKMVNPPKDAKIW